jgi:hypothetical protein
VFSDIAALRDQADEKKLVCACILSVMCTNTELVFFLVHAKKVSYNMKIFCDQYVHSKLWNILSRVLSNYNF